MSRRYKGGVISATAPTTSTSTATGVWTLPQQMQAQAAGNWPVPPVISVGSVASLSDAVSATGVSPLSTTSAIITYIDATLDGLYVVVATLSGTTITYGTPVLVRSGAAPVGCSIAAISSTSAIVVYEDSVDNYLAARGMTISGTTITIGTEVTNSLVSTGPNICQLTSTTAICAYKQSGSKAVVLSLGGTTVSFGSAVTATGNINAGVSISKLSSTSAIMIRDNASNSNYPTVNVMTISGTTITMGSNAVVESLAVSSSNTFLGITGISSSGAIAVWKDDASDFAKAVAMTISGTTPTIGTVQTITSSTTYSSRSSALQPIATVSSTKAIFVYSAPTTGYGNVIVLTASGTSLTYSTPQSTINSDTRYPSISQINGQISFNAFGISTTSLSSQTITVL